MWGRTFSLLTVITTLSGVGSEPKFLEQWASFVPFKCVLSSLLSPWFLPQERRALKDGSLCSFSSCVGYRPKSKLSPRCCFCITSIFTPHSVQIQALFVPHGWPHLQSLTSFSLLWSCTAGRRGLYGISVCICLWAVVDLLLSEFWDASDMLLEKNKKMANAVQRLALNQVTFVFHSQAFSQAIDPVLQCNVE